VGLLADGSLVREALPPGWGGSTLPALSPTDALSWRPHVGPAEMVPADVERSRRSTEPPLAPRAYPSGTTGPRHWRGGWSRSPRFERRGSPLVSTDIRLRELHRAAAGVTLISFIADCKVPADRFSTHLPWPPGAPDSPLERPRLCTGPPRLTRAAGTARAGVTAAPSPVSWPGRRLQRDRPPERAERAIDAPLTTFRWPTKPGKTREKCGLRLIPWTLGRCQRSLQVLAPRVLSHSSDGKRS
jgi:hypothetical protein